MHFTAHEPGASKRVFPKMHPMRCIGLFARQKGVNYRRPRTRVRQESHDVSHLGYYANHIEVHAAQEDLVGTQLKRVAYLVLLKPVRHERVDRVTAGAGGRHARTRIHPLHSIVFPEPFHALRIFEPVTAEQRSFFVGAARRIARAEVREIGLPQFLSKQPKSCFLICCRQWPPVIGVSPLIIHLEYQRQRISLINLHPLNEALKCIKIDILEVLV